MTVKETIEQLKQIPEKDAELYIDNFEGKYNVTDFEIKKTEHFDPYEGLTIETEVIIKY